MKKLCYSAFIAFWAAIATLLALQAVATDEAPHAPAEKVITLEELAGHSGEEDCWMAIEGAVYELTDYLSRHPTPASVLVPWCGRDATEGMRTKGYGRDHSQTAWQMLENYRIGTLQQ